MPFLHSLLPLLLPPSPVLLHDNLLAPRCQATLACPTCPPSAMAYSLAKSFAGESLLTGFNWFDGIDPTHGFVSYQNRTSAQAKGLFSVDEKTGVVRLGVDHTNTYAVNEGRPSVRLESKASFNHGLFIADFLHMPSSQCSLWLACTLWQPPPPSCDETTDALHSLDIWRQLADRW